METTRRFVLVLIGLWVCGCMICAPTPTPTPTPSPVGWEPSGSALWPSGTMIASVDPLIQTAGQGGNHLQATVSIGAGGLSSATEVRIAVFLRTGPTLVGSSNRRVTLDASSTQFALNVQICPADRVVIGQALQWEIWAAREGDHQLLAQGLGTVTPACTGNECGACR